MSRQTLTLPDNRQLGYAIEGKGTPVIYFHGTASSRLEILLLKQFAQTYHFKLVGIDRPGYGLSTFIPRRNLHDFTHDVNILAKHLQLDQFAVLSWSGGGPFALTYLALFPECVSRAVIVGSPTLPFNATAAHNNNPLAKIAIKNQHIAMCALKSFKKTILKANLDIEAYLKSKNGRKMLVELPKPDAKFFANPAWLKLMYASTAEAFRQGNDSVKTIFQEHKLFMQTWNEPLTQIPPNKLIIWQGIQDKTCQPDNAYKIAQTIKGAQVELFPNEGHCVMFSETEKLSEALNS